MKKYALIPVILFIYSFVPAQNLSQKISAKALKENLFVSSDIIGELGGNLLIANTNAMAFSPECIKDENNKIELALYNKTSFNLIKTIPLKWKGGKRMHEDLKWSINKNIFIIDNQVYVVWQKYENKRYSLLMQTFDANLRETKAPTTFYELPAEFSAYNGAVLFCMVSPDKNAIILGGEESAQRKENVKIQYKVFNKNLQVIQTVQAALPFYKKGRNIGTAANYIPDNNGDLYYFTIVTAKTNKSKEKAIIIGKISAENSKADEVYLEKEKLDIIDLKIALTETSIKGFAVTSKGLSTFTIDKPSFTLQDDFVQNDSDPSKITFSDYNKSLTRSSIEANTLNKVFNEDLRISNIKALSNGRFILTLNNMVYYEVCTRYSCTPYTKMDGQHYALINADGTLEWLACTKQKLKHTTYYQPDNDVAVYNNTMYASTLGSMAIHAVDLNTGKVIIKAVEPKHKYCIIDIENDRLYYTDYKQRKSVATYAITAGVVGAGAAVTLTTGSLFYIFPGIVGGIAVAAYGRDVTHLYAGEFVINNK